MNRGALGSSALGSAVAAAVTPDPFGQGILAALALVGAFLFLRAAWRTARAPTEGDQNHG